MVEVAHILWGALFTVAVSVAAGHLLMRCLGLSWHRMEATILAFIVGSSCLSFLIALLCLVHQARRGVFLWSGVGLLACHLRLKTSRKSLPPIPTPWSILFLLVFTAFFLCYFVNALAPEVSPDGSGYHLGNVIRIWQHHGFDWDYRSLYSYLSQGTEMLFLMAYTFGGRSAAALVHLSFLVALPLLMLCYGRRFGLIPAATFAAILVFACPIAGMDGVAAYNDIALATLIYAVFYLLQVWAEEQSNNLLILIGLLSGAGYAVKYTAFLVFPFAMGFVLLHWRTHTTSAAYKLRSLIALTTSALLLVAPWILRNAIWVGNPFAPFFNAWFPNPYYHTGMEKIYVDGLKHYLGIKSHWEIPLQLTLRGSLVTGVVGPVFLLAPLALLALRQRQGRQLLAAAAIFALPAYLNTGTRFLLPSLPFLSLALGVALAQSPGILCAIAVFHAVVSWPSVLSTYCDQWAWRISSIPVKMALRQEPEGPYILRHLGDYAMKPAIDLNVPPGEKIFSFAGRPEAYIDRDIVIQYESNLGNLIQDILQTPQNHPPKHLQAFPFLPVRARGVRVVNSASAENFWSVAEMRVAYQGREVPRSPDWRVSAWPNAWEAPLAFDNSYATRWSTWEAMSPGARLQVEFPGPVTIDSVWLECDMAWEAKVEVQILIESGRWVPITDTAEHGTVPPPTGIRRAATRDVKALGIRFLWINDGDFCAQDMKSYSNFWGITLIAEANGAKLYRID